MAPIRCTTFTRIWFLSRPKVTFSNPCTPSSNSSNLSKECHSSKCSLNWSNRWISSKSINSFIDQWTSNNSQVLSLSSLRCNNLSFKTNSSQRKEPHLSQDLSLSNPVRQSWLTLMMILDRLPWVQAFHRSCPIIAAARTSWTVQHLLLSTTCLSLQTGPSIQTPVVWAKSQLTRSEMTKSRQFLACSMSRTTSQFTVSVRLTLLSMLKAPINSRCNSWSLAISAGSRSTKPVRRRTSSYRKAISIEWHLSSAICVNSKKWILFSLQSLHCSDLS